MAIGPGLEEDQWIPRKEDPRLPASFWADPLAQQPDEHHAAQAGCDGQEFLIQHGIEKLVASRLARQRTQYHPERPIACWHRLPAIVGEKGIQREGGRGDRKSVPVI